MSKKPYIYRGFEWLEIVRKRDWNDPVANPDDSAAYSEFQKPYLNADGDHDYPSWEWTWPDITWPPIEDVTFPDPTDGPCDFEEGCQWVVIVGFGDKLECGDCYWYNQAHNYVSCDYIPFWVAFCQWSLEGSPDGKCYIQDHERLMGIVVCCDEDATPQELVLTVDCHGCMDSKEITVECEGDCCEDLEVTGAGTVTAGNTWTGSISPNCPAATCEVVSNSGCSLGCSMDESGSQVTVSTGGGDCGAFTVTTTRAAVGDCVKQEVSNGVRIIDGVVDWEHDQSFGGGCTGDCGGGGVTFFNDSCVLGEYKYGGFDPTDNNPCTGTWLVQCKGSGDPEACDCSGGGISPPCPVHSCGCSGGYCCCHWSWWRCDWTCVC